MRLDIAVVCLPGSRGVGAFPMLEQLAGDCIRYVEEASGLKRPDLIFLSGAGQVMEGLAWLHRSGMGEQIRRAWKRGTVVFGLGSGYYMLGEMVSDPRGAETGGSIRGLGLLPIDTVLTAARTRAQVQGRFGKLEGVLEGLSQLPLEGEELHLGTDMLRNAMQAVAMLSDEEGLLAKCEGAQGEDVYGTCIQGIFEQEEAARRLLGAFLE